MIDLFWALVAIIALDHLVETSDILWLLVFLLTAGLIFLRAAFRDYTPPKGLK